MTPHSFFPSMPHALNVLTATGLLLIVGLLGARLLRRFFPQIPAITGYVLTGLLIGPSVLNLLDASLLDDISVLVDLALGLVLFELGRRVDYKWLLREKGLLITGIAMSTIMFFALFTLLVQFGVGKLVACMVAALGMATSPAVILNVVREVKAEGQLTERMLNIVVIGNALAFVVFSMGLAAVHVEYQAGWKSYLLHPLYLLLGSALLGWIISRLLVWIGQWLGRDTQAQLILVLALIAATVGIAVMFKLSALIALLFFGISSRNQDARHAIVEPDLSQFSGLFYVALFVFAGAKLELGHLLTLWPAVLAFIALRLAVALATSTGLARLNGMTIRKGALLGVGLVPLSGFNIIMVQHAVGDYPQFGAQLSALVVSILVILELLGPICTRYALTASGEAKN
ncbi:MAG TPA: cation:proton antiporter [Oxalicibacterium sp.]|uniref:cation:proton antiporter n=1 Tax=Oxalicibacterium sp. TaxID=2766525 RepID=UPI002CFCC4CA|nr:cation:proton antiporter [Oxalicibacterium sp.]HWU98433.1 cation:proton antiporter [Oxalicibacterium sp.]